MRLDSCLYEFQREVAEAAPEFWLVRLSVAALLQGALVARMPEAVLAEAFILNYKIKVRHFRGWWDGTDRDYRSVPKA